MTKAIVHEMKETKKVLLQAISSFPPQDFNTIPFEGSWTPAQVADHVLKSVSGVLELLYAPVLPTNRDPEENAAALKNTFLDFTTKMQSPEFVLPGHAPMEKEYLSTALEHTFSKIINDMQELDLTKTCKGFELPGSAPFTRAEWIWFAIYHTQRHTRQLKNIHAVIAGKKQAMK